MSIIPVVFLFIHIFFFFFSAMISYNVIIGDTITKIIIRVGGGNFFLIFEDMQVNSNKRFHYPTYLLCCSSGLDN